MSSSAEGAVAMSLTANESSLPGLEPLGRLVAFQRDPETIKRVLDERSVALARPADFTSLEAHENGRQMIRFRAGESHYGLELANLREIRKVESIAVVPCTPRFLLGLVQVHGEITPVIDLVEFLGFRRTAPLGEVVMVMVLEVGGAMLGVAVDELEDVHPLNEHQLKPTPAILNHIEQEAASGVLLDGTVILDAEALADHPRLAIGKRERGGQR